MTKLCAKDYSRDFIEDQTWEHMEQIHSLYWRDEGTQRKVCHLRHWHDIKTSQMVNTKEN